MGETNLILAIIMLALHHPPLDVMEEEVVVVEEEGVEKEGPEVEEKGVTEGVDEGEVMALSVAEWGSLHHHQEAEDEGEMTILIDQQQPLLHDPSMEWHLIV